MATTYLVVGYNVGSSGLACRAYVYNRTNGQPIFYISGPTSTSTDGGFLGVDVDEYENIYTCGYNIGTYEVNVYNKNGDLLWRVSHGANANSICAKGDFVVCVFTRNNSITTRAYDRRGNAKWTYDHGANLSGVWIREDGNVLITGTRSSGYSTRLLNSNGGVVASYSSSYDGVEITADSSNNVYLAQNTSAAEAIKLSSTLGSVLWTYNPSGPDMGGRGIGVSGGQYVAIGMGDSVPYNEPYMMCLVNASTGAKVFYRGTQDSATRGGNKYGADTDPDGFAYFGGHRWDPSYLNVLHCYTTSGDAVWRITAPTNQLGVRDLKIRVLDLVPPSPPPPETPEEIKGLHPLLIRRSWARKLL